MRLSSNHVFGAHIEQVDFHDLDFVEASGVPGPDKSGVEHAGFVALKVSCSHAKIWFCRSRFDVFLGMRLTNLKPLEASTLPGQFLTLRF